MGRPLGGGDEWKVGKGGDPMSMRVCLGPVVRQAARAVGTRRPAPSPATDPTPRPSLHAHTHTPLVLPNRNSGVLRVEFDDGDVYVWSKVTTSINNLVLGKIYIDHGGIMRVRGLSSGLTMRVRFKETGIFDRDPRQVGALGFACRGLAAAVPFLAGFPPERGVALGRRALAALLRCWSCLLGGWEEGEGGRIAGRASGEPAPGARLATARPPPPALPQVRGVMERGEQRLDRPSLSGHWDSNLEAELEDGRVVELWRKNAPPREPTRYNLTTFAIQLNEQTPDTRRAAPTDCRRRPDQHCLELGEYDEVRGPEGRPGCSHPAGTRARAHACVFLGAETSRAALPGGAGGGGLCARRPPTPRLPALPERPRTISAADPMPPPLPLTNKQASKQTHVQTKQTASQANSEKQRLEIKQRAARKAAERGEPLRPRWFEHMASAKPGEEPSYR